jgi:hypothetical protein
LNTQLGYNGFGEYGMRLKYRESDEADLRAGFDTVGLGFSSDEGPTLKHQVVSAIVSDTWWFGMLGLGFQPTNFSTYGNPQASFSDTLYSNGTISSMSWSYTAGAYYRLKSVYGSLIFGGYDASRFTPNDVSFTMAGDVHRDIVVTIRSITSTTSSGNTTLMSTPIFSFIDSTVPEIWLPVDVCQQFETAFGLTLDQASGLYLIDNSTHENLLNLNPNITFTLANEKTGGPTIDFVLPYASFDLNTTAPVLDNRSSLYFPIKQTSDDTLYTLGRTFLQEAYVTADYNSRTFNVSQCIFDDTASAHVVAIPSNLPNSTSGGNSTGSGTGSGSHKSLGGGAIAGIVIGALAAILLGIALIFFCIRRRRREPARPSTPVAEIDTGKRVEGGPSSAYSAQASAFTSEVSGQDAKVEIQGNPIMYPQELEAEVPLAQGQDASERVNGPSDSSRETGVSAMSPIIERPTPLAELGADERGLGEGTRRDRQDGGGGEEQIVSPNSDSARGDSMMQRGRPNIVVDSPVSEATWTPTTPVQRRNSRFSEHWE